MLAMYGQVFPDELFNALRDLSSENVTMDLILAKQQYLKNIAEYANQRNKINWLSRIYGLLGMNSEKTSDVEKPFFVEGTEKDYIGDLFIFWSCETRFTATEEKRRALEEFIQDELPAQIRPLFFWGESSVLNDEEFLDAFFEVYKDPENGRNQYPEIANLVKDRTVVIVR